MDDEVILMNIHRFIARNHQFRDLDPGLPAPRTVSEVEGYRQ